MGIKTYLAKGIGNLSGKILSMTGGGSSYPGKIASKIDKDILANLSNNYEVIMVTGTNGKTFTTSLLASMMKLRDGAVLTNSSGANLIQGITTTFLTDKNRKKAKVAILEIDEATLKHITPYIEPDILIITNVFNDQVDRYANPKVTYSEILKGLSFTQKTKVILNGDLPIFKSKIIENKHLYFGFDNWKNPDFEVDTASDDISCPVCENNLSYDTNVYANLGNYHCETCEFTRPHLDYKVEEILELTPEYSKFRIAGKDFFLGAAGLYNVYNALGVYAVAKELGISEDIIEQTLSNVTEIFGRQEKVKIANKDVVLNIMKNPAGINQLIDLIALDDGDYGNVLIINDNIADGTDISWISDANFEKLTSLVKGKVIIGGIRRKDLKARMVEAGISEDMVIMVDDISDIDGEIINHSQDKIYLLATYTAMLELRKIWKSKKYI